jgi:DivIVA domain-containing protein
MELTPSQVSAATFRVVRKGYDPDEVDPFLRAVARALEQAQQQATAMEARARAAVARLQEVQSGSGTQDDTQPMPAPVERGDAVHVSRDEAETISRTLLLAQRTADSTVAEALAEAERITNEARTEAEVTIDSTREMSAKLLDEARAEARKSTEAQRQAAQNEVESLVARREFLIGDVDQLEQFLIEQRERLRGAARQIEALCERVPAGLGFVPPPALSASDDEPGDDTAEMFLPPEAGGPFATVDELAAALEAAEAHLPSKSTSTTDGGPVDTDGNGAAELPIRRDRTDLPTRGEHSASD